MSILCSISTKDRYDSLLLAVQSVAMQTVRPDKLVIFDDGECKDLRQDSNWIHMFKLLDIKKIKWEVRFGNKTGQHHNHQIANHMGFDFVWRLDDDEIAEPNVLSGLLKHMKDGVGAVGGAVVMPDPQFQFPEQGQLNKITGIYGEPNFQWTIGKKVLEVEHLYSSFLYRGGINDYTMELSPVAHREETMFSHEIYRKGFKLIVDNSLITWHFRQTKGGIRSHTDGTMYEWDESVFLKKMNNWGYGVISLDCGLGDHFAFLNILPELKKKYKHIIIGACYPDVFEGIEGITLATIASMKTAMPNGKDSVYKWMIDHNWKTNVVDAFRGMYL
jgi:hypothetical protein